MKKSIILIAFALVAIRCLFALNDPFATRSFQNEEIEISFRVQDSEGRPQVKFVNGKSKSQCYYTFDEDSIVLFDENGNSVKVLGYCFINNGEGLRLFDEGGRFYDLASDNCKTTGDRVWESVDTVMQNFLTYGASGTVIGAVIGGPIGAAIGLGIGGVLGAGKALAHNILGWF